MTDVRRMLIRSSEKVIAHYPLQLAGARSHKERDLYLRRMAREQRLMDGLQDAMPRRPAE